MCFSAIQKVPEPETIVPQILGIVLGIGINDPGRPAPEIKKDVIIIMDGSGSVAGDQFDKGKQAIKHMMDMEEEHGQDTKFAAITFSSGATCNFTFLSIEEAGIAIGRIRHPDGDTNTQAALVKARSLFEGHEQISG